MGPELRLILVVVWAWAPLLTGAEPGQDHVLQIKLKPLLPPGFKVEGPQREARVRDPVLQTKVWYLPPPGVRGGANMIPSPHAVPSGGLAAEQLRHTAALPGPQPDSPSSGGCSRCGAQRLPQASRTPPGNVHHLPSNNVGFQGWWSQEPGNPGERPNAQNGNVASQQLHKETTKQTRPNSEFPPGNQGWGYNWQRFSAGQSHGANHNEGPSAGAQEPSVGYQVWAFGGPGDQSGQRSNFLLGSQEQVSREASSQTPSQNPNLPPGHRGWFYSQQMGENQGAQQNAGPSSSSSTNPEEAGSTFPQRSGNVDLVQTWSSGVFRGQPQPPTFSEQYPFKPQGAQSGQSGQFEGRQHHRGQSLQPSKPSHQRLGQTSGSYIRYPPPSGQVSPATSDQSNHEYNIRYQAWVNREELGQGQSRGRQSSYSGPQHFSQSSSLITKKQKPSAPKRPLSNRLEPNVGSPNYPHVKPRNEEKTSQWLQVRPQHVGGKSQSQPSEEPPSNHPGSSVRYQLWSSRGGRQNQPVPQKGSGQASHSPQILPGFTSQRVSPGSSDTVEANQKYPVYGSVDGPHSRVFVQSGEPHSNKRPSDNPGSNVRYQVWSNQALPPETDAQEQRPSNPGNQNAGPPNPSHQLQPQHVPNVPSSSDGREKPLGTPQLPARFYSVRSQLLPHSFLFNTKPQGQRSVDGKPQGSAAVWQEQGSEGKKRPDEEKSITVPPLGEDFVVSGSAFSNIGPRRV